MRVKKLITAVMLASAVAARPQQSPIDSKPYAAINRSAIYYSGPDRDAVHDLAGAEVKIGILAPLQGARKPEGEALLAAARLAIEDESGAPLSGGRRLVLAARDESGLWGRASSEIVKLVIDDRAVALITSSDGRAAHLAEQVGNRLGVPVLSLATDSQNTQINIPWYFRLVPDDAAQARLFAEDIFRRRRFERVAVVFEGDHDGKVGKEAFEKAARSLNAPTPAAFEIPASGTNVSPVVAEIAASRPQAIVVWGSAEAAARISRSLLDSGTEIYVCHKALREPFTGAVREASEVRLWTATSKAAFGLGEDFDRRFRARFGAPATPAAREMYDGVRLVAARLRDSGANRARLRDALAAHGEYRGVSGTIAFDGAGNNLTDLTLIPLR